MFDLNTWIPGTSIGIFLIVIWEAFWKAISLWKSARRGQFKWFIPIFVVNSFGILPIFYLWHTKQLENTLTDTLKFLRLKKN